MSITDVMLERLSHSSDVQDRRGRQSPRSTRPFAGPDAVETFAQRRAPNVDGRRIEHRQMVARDEPRDGRGEARDLDVVTLPLNVMDHVPALDLPIHLGREFHRAVMHRR
jgi:hypothetical protein